MPFGGERLAIPLFSLTTTLGDYDTALAPDPAAVDAIGRDPAGRADEFIYTLADDVT